MAEEYLPRSGLLNEYDRRHQGPPGGARRIMEEYTAADVVSASAVRDAVDEAIRVLNALNGTGRLEYGDYSELYDVISEIYCEEE